jgi:phosphoserine aminotransferase
MGPGIGYNRLGVVRCGAQSNAARYGHLLVVFVARRAIAPAAERRHAGAPHSVPVTIAIEQRA